MSKSESESQLTFEQALAQVETIIAGIEQGKVGLQEAVTQYEKGMKLIQHCRAVLSDAEARIQVLQLGEGNKPTPAPFQAPPAE